MLLLAPYGRSAAIKPSLSKNLPPFQGKKVIKPYVSFKHLPPYSHNQINQCETVLINHNLKNTSCQLLQYGLFTRWKFEFVFDLRRHEVQLHLLGFATLRLVLYEKSISSSGCLIKSSI